MTDESILSAIDQQILYHLERMEDYGRAKSALTGTPTDLREFIPKLDNNTREQKPITIAQVGGGTYTFGSSAGGTVTAIPATFSQPKPTISDETRLRMKRAQQNRWAKKSVPVKKSPATPLETLTKLMNRPRREISPEGKARIAAAQVKRWRKVKREKKKEAKLSA